jgi:hypothetical protein
MKIMKILGVIGVTVILLFVFLTKFSTVGSRFQCPGEISSIDGSHPITVYLKLEEYRWWVGLWSESDAAVYIEIPNTHVDNFNDVKKVGDQYQIFDSSKKVKGNFSVLSKALAINIPLREQINFFEGVCSEID